MKRIENNKPIKAIECFSNSITHFLSWGESRWVNRFTVTLVGLAKACLKLFVFNSNEAEITEKILKWCNSSPASTCQPFPHVNTVGHICEAFISQMNFMNLMLPLRPFRSWRTVTHGNLCNLWLKSWERIVEIMKLNYTFVRNSFHANRNRWLQACGSLAKIFLRQFPAKSARNRIKSLLSSRASRCAGAKMR